MLFVRPTVLLVFDRLTDELFVVAPVWSGGSIERSGERIDEVLLRKLARPAIPSETRAADHARTRALTPTMPAADYEAMVLRAKDYIEAGDIFEVVLVAALRHPFELPPMALYRALRRVNPSPFLYFLDIPGLRSSAQAQKFLSGCATVN